MTLRKYINFLSVRINPKDGHILIKGDRVAMVPTEMFTELYLGLSKVMGKTGAATAFYFGAKNSGHVLYDIGMKLYGEENMKSEERFPKILDELLSIAGYGRCEVEKVDFTDVEVVIRLRGLLTSSGIDDSDVPVCHAERGAMTGIVESITGKQLKGQETKCQAMGDDYCEFYISEGP
ncbi:MAG: 4-vinyl reductase [Halobacteriota archaeon]|nr:4-vinyl reductase [Halobacteriota archaeon]